MRKALFALLVLGLLPAAAGAVPSKDDVEEARKESEQAAARARELLGEVRKLTERYHELGERADRAAAELIDAYRAELRLEAQLVEARATLNRRANAAYRVGPGAVISVFLDSESATDFLSSQQLISRTILADIQTAAETLESSEEAQEARRTLEERRQNVVQRYEELEALQTQIQKDLQQARAHAKAAGIRLRELAEMRRRFLEEQRARAAATGVDQSGLLALLGPSGGRGCNIPPRLRQTGKGFSGTASWYGWEFAGQPTASGAIYDPRLFTAAHKTLPLNTFIRVRYKGRCATVLVNDRGPYANGWVLDLSEAAADYLGYKNAGTADVDADILERR